MNARLRSLCCAMLVASAAVPAWADIGRDQAAAVAQRVASGRVLAVERTEFGGKPAWRVKILSAQGEVRVVIVEAAGGRVVG
jgi:uncharacterized membrane protein YkoI